ncbi:NCS2 family permease [Planomonospora venezuelensis]|uniref:AGZA family xanthine/uracil permease-like MFS transporter n=1 Tax=Planomonospora venezuelensis TaxID=1999 RepID=A0A841CWI3_PLAVE|nr:AGZA family xanthine/uracil permease-like MFS transporter [Planomonospora venezuelensis]GIM98815.1 MFS transporter [Planomonospora venezuelensis]
MDRFFELSARGTTVGREVRGGLTTFMAMAYIILLNPIILGGATDVTGAKLSVPQLTTATILAAAVGTVLMAVAGNAPFGLAAGLGLNAVVAYQAAPHMTWAQAMGLVVLEGLVIVLLAVSGLRQLIMNAIPLALKHAISVGIGAFIALIGLVDAGFVARGEGTPVQLGTTGHLSGWPVALFCLGLLLMIVLYVRRTPAAILIGIAVTAVLAVVVNSVAAIDPASWGVVVPRVPDALVAAPDFGLIGQVDLFGGFARAGAVTATVVLFTLVLSGFFDAMGTIIGVSDEAGLVDEQGRVPRLGAILTVDGVAGAIGGLSSASAGTVFVESAAGVGEGARTGLAALVTGGLFTLTLLFTPVATVVPAAAAAPALVLVGALMMTQAKNVPWDDLTMAIPAFLTIVLMPFTYSITNGVGAGVIAYTVVQAATGRARRLPWLLWVVALVFLVYFGIDAVERLIA